MQITGEQLAAVLFAVMFAGIVWMPLTWLLLSIFTPKTLLEKYFKEPHFTLTETILMAQFPGFLLRTVIFGWLLVLPTLGKKRKIKEVKHYVPRWYAVALRLFIIACMVSLFLIVVLMGVLLIMEPDGSGVVK